MNNSDRITLSFPKGVKRKDLVIIIIFAIVMGVLYQTLQNVIASSSQNPNFALVVIVMILLVICFLFVYVTRMLHKEERISDETSVNDSHSE